MKVLAKETKYNGIKFRSKLEAEYARFFDYFNIKYLYEVEGYDLGEGVWYLPDFYLYEMDVFFECKGIMSDKDLTKIKKLAEQSDKNIFIGYYPVPNKVEMYGREWEDEGWDVDYIIDNVAMFECGKCGKYFFGTTSGYYKCKVCGAYDGDGHLSGCTKFKDINKYSWGINYPKTNNIRD